MPKDGTIFLSVCLNPTLQKTLRFDTLVRDAVNRTGEHYLDASGKGVNVTRVLSQLGERVIHLTHAGGVNRSLFLSLLEADRLEAVCPDSGSEIRFCHTLLEASSGSVTELVEESAPVSAGTEERIVEAYGKLLPRAHTVIISGTKAAGYSDTLFPAMVERAREAGVFVVLDVRGRDLTACLPKRPDVIKPNYGEFLATFFADGGAASDDDLIEAAFGKLESVYRDYGARTVLTRGKRDTMAFDGRKRIVFPTMAVNTLNSTGSGDAFAAGFSSALRAGRSFFEAIGEGARCGARNASLVRPGVIE